MEASLATRVRVFGGPRHVRDEEVVSKKGVAPILRLSPTLRRLIYLETELVAQYFAYEYTVLNPESEQPIPSLWNCQAVPKRGFYGLLVCCRTIYAEASALLYGSNRFLARYWDRQTLAPLRDLAPSSLSSLTHLKIILNQSSCHHGLYPTYEDCSGVCDDERGINEFTGSENWGEKKKALHNAPLNISDPQAKVLVDEWVSTAEYLARHISPQKLELCIVCDIHHDDLETAGRVVEPLRLFPELRNCHIRLSRTPSSQLRRIAEESVLKARRMFNPQFSGCIPSQTQSTGDGVTVEKHRQHTESHFLNLPRELRFHILSYTDLITPWKEVELSRQRHHSWKYIALNPIDANSSSWSLYCPELHHGCQFLNCWNVSNPQSKSGIGCFCQVRHAAASSTCMCWVPPSALFLVCRTLLQDAQVVFFSGNRFVVHDFQVNPPWITPDYLTLRESQGGFLDPGVKLTEFAKYHSDRLAASIFLRDVVPLLMLREIRELEFVFPPYSHVGWPEEGHPALADWADTLVWAKDKMNFGRLTLRLVLADSFFGWEIPPGREEITSDQVEDIMLAYRRIASPISVLAPTNGTNVVRGGRDAVELCNFHAMVAWPWYWNWGYEEKYYEHGWEWVLDYRENRCREMKEEAERWVMGERSDVYHVSDRAQPWTSIWETEFRGDL